VTGPAFSEDITSENAHLRDQIEKALEKHPEARAVAEAIARKQESHEDPLLVRANLQERARALIEPHPDVEGLFPGLTTRVVRSMGGGTEVLNSLVAARGLSASSGTASFRKKEEVEEAFKAMQERLRVLEITISQMPPPPAGLGHNNPPEPIEDLPISAAEWEEVRRSLDVLKQQPVAPEQEPKEAKIALSRLKAIREKVLSYLGRHFDEFSSASAKTLGAGAATWVLAHYGHASLASLANGVIDLSSHAEVWLRSLGF
jgi:hypothetical protein